MLPTKYLAALLLLGAPVTSVVTDGRDPVSIPKLDVPEPPEWEDIEHPEFEPYPVSAGQELLDNAVLEQFYGSDEEVFSRWKISNAEREAGVKYVGEWSLEEPDPFKGFNNDRGLVLKSENAAGAIARKFDNPIDTTSGTKPFVVQYEVKNQVRLRCGGAYIKVLPTTDDVDYSYFSNETPYLVMFGPDKCGATDKIHFILRRNGVEHHLVQPPPSRPGLLSVLYTLIIHPNLDFEIRVDGLTVRSGSMLDELEFSPPLAPPRDMLDPNDTKPDSWDEEEYIPDPNETEKPEDWDESEPRLIHDPEATKPAAWKEDVPLFIKDPSAVKPEFWDDEEDGEFVAPEILNPECQNLDSEAGEGCGEWLAPLIKNPKYKGKWTQPLVPNPKYKGQWTPRRIPNTEFREEELISTLSKMDSDVGGVGFELLTVQGNSLFDNVYVGSSVRDAENIGNATWSPKLILETESQNAAIEAYQKQEKEALKASPESHNEDQSLFARLSRRYSIELTLFKASPVNYVADLYHDFLDSFRASKVETLKEYPVTAAVFFISFHLITSLLFGIFGAIRAVLFGNKGKAPRAQPKTAAVATTATITPVAVSDTKEANEVNDHDTKLAAVDTVEIDTTKVDDF